MSNTNRSWTNEKGNEGFHVSIGLSDIRVDMYSLPITKYSGGTSNYFKFEDLREGSDLFNLLKNRFSEDVANAALKVILEKGENPEFQKHQASLDNIDKWFGKLEENKSIKSLWDQSQKIGLFSADDISNMAHFGIKKGALQEYNVPFIDSSTNKQFTFDHNRSQIYATKKSTVWKAFLFNNKELIILHEVLGELIVYRPFEEIIESVTEMDGQICSMRRSNDLILVDFSKNRIRTEFGYYLLVINPNSGKIMYQKVN